MKIIFLDIWGVLCLPDKHRREHKKTDLPNIKEMKVHGKLIPFNKEAVNVLNSIIEKADVEIVISSDWKKWCPLNEMKKFYKAQGIIKTPIDYTTNLNVKNLFERRSLEIKSWLNNHKVNNWVAVDDLYLNLDNFVWISKTDEGLTQEGIKENILIYIV